MTEQRVTNEKIEKLPVWAQKYIYHLQSEVRRHYGYVVEHTANHKDSPVKIVAGYGTPDWGLPPDTQIRFELGEDRRWIEARIVEAFGSKQLYLMGGDCLLVLPSSGNTVNVDAGDIRHLRGL